MVGGSRVERGERFAVESPLYRIRSFLLPSSQGSNSTKKYSNTYSKISILEGQCIVRWKLDQGKSSEIEDTQKRKTIKCDFTKLDIKLLFCVCDRLELNSGTVDPYFGFSLVLPETLQIDFI